MKQISPEILDELLSYNERTGKLYWKPRPEKYFKALRFCEAWNTRFANKEACKLSERGYYRVKVFGKKYMAHRLIWAMIHRKYPSKEIDHINGNTLDNRIVNLRECNRSQNIQNTKKRSGCKSMYKGVKAHCSGKWHASICTDSGVVYLGSFDVEEEAAKAYDKAAREYFKEFARTNF